MAIPGGTLAVFRRALCNYFLSLCAFLQPVAFVSQKRYLKRSGPLVHIGGTPGKKNILKNADKSKVTVFLFNDMVIIAKLKKRP